MGSDVIRMVMTSNSLMVLVPLFRIDGGEETPLPKTGSTCGAVYLLFRNVKSGENISTEWSGKTRDGFEVRNRRLRLAVEQVFDRSFRILVDPLNCRMAGDALDNAQRSVEHDHTGCG